MRTQMRFPAVVVTAVLSAILVLGAQVAWAVFNDVNGSPFVDEISEIGNAGCASGFPDGGFHPQDTVKRQQFAYWTANCGGRARTQSFDAVDVVRNGTVTGTTFETTFRTPGVAGQQGHLLVTGWSNMATTDGEHCPCHTQAQLIVHGQSSNPVGTATLGPDESPHSGTAAVQLSVTDLVVVPTDTVISLSIRPAVYDDDLASVIFSGEVTVLYVPFNGTPTVG